MPTTSPDSIYYADGTTPASIATITAAMATSVQNALNVRETKSYSWADATAKAAQTGMATGEIGHQIDNDTYYIYSGSAWRIWAKQPTAYTPTLGGITSTAFTTAFVYSIAGGVVNVTGNVVMTGAVTGSGTFRVSLPSGYSINTSYVIIDTTYFKAPLGTSAYWDNSATREYVGYVTAYDADNVALSRMAIPTSNLELGEVSTTQPFTWATSDSYSVNFSYPVA